MVSEDFTKLTFTERLAAQEKAYDLLWDNLSPWQRWTAINFSAIPVIDQHGSKWLINPYGRIQNVYNWDEDVWYCCATEDPGIPVADSVLGVVFMIKYNIDDFREIAIPLNGRPDLSQQFDLVFQMVSTHPEDMNEQTCCFQGSNSQLEDVCDYHRGIAIGKSIGIATGFYLYNNDTSLHRHLLDMINAVSLIEEMRHPRRRDDYNTILFGDMTYEDDAEGQRASIAAMEIVMKAMGEEVKSE